MNRIRPNEHTPSLLKIVWEDRNKPVIYEYICWSDDRWSCPICGNNYKEKQTAIDCRDNHFEGLGDGT